MILEHIIEQLYDTPLESIDRSDALEAIKQLKDSLNQGNIRAAEYHNGTWHVNSWVKKGILLAFRLGELTSIPTYGGFQFFDKETLTLQKFSLERKVRIVPGGTAIRDGVFVAPGVIVMPPSYINIGAYIDEQTMIDSNVLVGSCAQIGKRVHLSAGVQIGGVLEPIGSLPVIIENDAFIGGNCGIYEGTIIKKCAVIGAGVILTGSTPVYDVVNKTIYKRTAEQPLVIPEKAVVVPGNRRIDNSFAKEQGLSIYAAIIVKYRDEKTATAIELEDSLR